MASVHCCICDACGCWYVRADVDGRTEHAHRSASYKLSKVRPHAIRVAAIWMRSTTAGKIMVTSRAFLSPLIAALALMFGLHDVTDVVRLRQPPLPSRPYWHPGPLSGCCRAAPRSARCVAAGKESNKHYECAHWPCVYDTGRGA